MTTQKSLEDRTESKLEYARLHLGELRERPENVARGLPFSRAHEESCLFHVIGAKDAFLQEINSAFALGLEMHKVSEGNLAEALRRAKKTCAALNEIQALPTSEGMNWFVVATELRNHGTHRTSIPRVFYVGGAEDGLVHYRHPGDGSIIKQDIPDFLGSVIDEMGRLIARLRSLLP